MLKKEKALSLSDKLYQASFLNRFEEFKITVHQKPWVIELDPTTACNLACHGCISASYLTKEALKERELRNLQKRIC